jgi:hypothetical protein
MAEVPPCIGGICHGRMPWGVRCWAGDSQASVKQILIEPQVLGMKNAFNNPEAL